LPQKEE